MPLFAYRQQVERLLADTTQRSFNIADIDFFINSARGQIAGEGECIRNYATLALAANVQQYAFSSITLAAGTQGVLGVFNVRMASYALPGVPGSNRITAREWEWFNQFVLMQNNPPAGQPKFWAQFGQGASGTLFFNLPDLPYVVSLDTVCFPNNLANDTDFEAIPYLWTDAVPYFAAYLALMQGQAQDRAANMFKLYQTFVMRARAAATPSALPLQYSQAPDPFMANRLGVRAAG